MADSSRCMNVFVDMPVTKKKRGRKFKNYIQDIDQWTKFSVVGSGDFRPISKLFSMNVTTSSPLSVFVSLYFLCKYTHKHTPR